MRKTTKKLKIPFAVALCTLTLVMLLTAGANSESPIHLDLNQPQDTQKYSDTCRENPVLEEEREYADYKIRISSAGDKMCHLIDIEKQGAVIYHDEEIGGHFFLGTDHEENGDPFLHLTKDNVPDLVFSKWTGGMHCCYSLHVFKIDGEFKEIANTRPSNFAPTLEDIDQDGVFEIKVIDDILAEAFSCFADSATGEVVLRYSGDKYQVSADDMKKPAPDLNAMNPQIESWRKMFEKGGNGDWPPPPFMQAITTLFFTGNRYEAFELINRVWPPHIGGKEDFIKSYLETIGESNFYREFEEQI